MNFLIIFYVGDLYDNDIMGVFNGGWYFMWFNYRGCFLKLGIKLVYDVVIDNFE